MSYAFTKCVEAQAAFEGSEELFVKFLTSLISTIIDPFKSLSFSKFNISKKQISQLNLLFTSIEHLYNFHSASHHKLEQPQVSHTSTNSNNLEVNIITSPPPNTYNPTNPYKHTRHTSNHHRTHSPNTQFGSNLNSFIFKYYEQLPMIYKQFFDKCIGLLPQLSNIITPNPSFKKWFRIKCDDITLLYDNTKPYDSIPQMLKDILSHGKDQAEKLQEIAKSKYLKNSIEAKAFKENMKLHLDDIFIQHWEEHLSKFDLLHMECILTQTNEQLYHQNRKLMLTFQIDLPTKARSTKNLFGLNKNKVAQQTQEGIFYIFSDMILICTKELKYKGIYSLNTNDNFIEIDANKNLIIFSKGNNDPKKVKVFMRKSEEFRVACHAITEYQKELRKPQIKCNISENELLGDYTNKKTPPIPIINGHNNSSHRYINNMTPESVYSASHSYSNPKYGHISAIQKSSSYPSQSSTYKPKITPSPSITQLEANTYYNRGRYSINGKDKQRSSMQTNVTDMTYSILTENTMYNDISEPRTSTAYSVQQTPVNNMSMTNTYKYDTNSIATPISDNKSSNVSSDKQSLIIHEDDTTMHFIDSDNENENENENVNENYINNSETKPIINDSEKREKFKLYRSESLKDGRRFSVPSMLSSIASSGKDNGSTDNEETLKEPSPNLNTINYKNINQLDVSDSDIRSDNDVKSVNKSQKFNKIRKRSKSMLSKQVRFKNNNSINSSNDNDINVNVPILKENEIIINLASKNNNVTNNSAPALHDFNGFDNLDDEIPIYDEEDILGKDDMANLSEEEYLLEENNNKILERETIQNTDLTKEDTPSIEMVDDPHDLGSVEFVDEDYTSDDDHSFKMKVLFKPKWAISDEPGHIREYPPIPTKEYYKMHKEILSPMEYSQNMHIYKLRLQQQLENKCQEIMNDETISKKKREKMVKQISDETNKQLINNKNKIPPHPFERFLDEMHLYEINGDNCMINNPRNNNKHGRMKSAELMVWDHNGDDVNDEETNQYLSIIDDKKPQLQPNQLSNASANSQSLSLPHIDDENCKSRLNSVSSLGPSPSMLHQEDDDDQKDESVMAPMDGTEAEGIYYSITSPTANVLERFNLQTNNCLLLAELQRLRNIISLQDDEMTSMETEIQHLNTSINDKEIQTKTLRNTNITLKSRNNALELENSKLGDELKTSKDANITLKKDNERLNDLVRDMENDSSMLPGDDDDDSCKSDHIASELVTHTQNIKNATQSQIKKQKFNDYTQKKKKKKIYHRKKYHSITLGQAKKEHMQRNRLKNRSGQPQPLEADHLSAVKSQLRGIKCGSMGLMPQSMTQITPQHSQRGTPRHGRSAIATVKKVSEKSLISATSSDDNLSLELPNPLLSLYEPVSAPTLPFHSSAPADMNTFGSPINSPSPRTSPLPMNGMNGGFPDRPNMIAVKGKSYDNIHKVGVYRESKYEKDISPQSPTSNHKRKDTPTPNKMNKSKFVYTKFQSEGMLLNADQSSLEQIQSMPNSAYNSARSSASILMDKQRTGNKRRISFANHHKMHYVEDDDHSDVSITNKSLNKKLSKLSKRRITYTKSANTYEHKSSSNLYNTKNNYHTKPTPKTTRKPNPDIPLYFSRGHSQSFSVQKSRQQRSGSISTKSSYSLGLKDRTGKNGNTNNPSNIKTTSTSLPHKKILYPQTPQIHAHSSYNKRETNRNTRVAPKRRSVNFMPSSKYILKPKPSERKKFISRSPNFEPKNIPPTYPNTFSDFTLNDTLNDQ